MLHLHLDRQKVVLESLIYSCSNKSCAFYSPFAVIECAECYTKRNKSNDDNRIGTC
jgi:hypothetical protein